MLTTRGASTGDGQGQPLVGCRAHLGRVAQGGIRVSKGTIQKHMRRARPPRGSGQTWATFLRNHAAAVWACDVVQVTDLCFRAGSVRIRNANER